MSDLPRLLLCCFDVIPAPTAISRRLTEYVKGLSDRYQVVVLTVKTPDHTHIERYHGARLLRVPVGSGDLAARVQSFDRAVRRQLDSEEYVMVHFFDPFSGYALCERRADFGFKLVYDACSLPSVELPLVVSEAEANRRFIAKVRRQELFCLMNADAVVVGNELTRDFVSSLGVPREQVQVLPAPVDLGPYDAQLMGVPDATPMKLLHLGNQSHGQDLPTLLEAMQLALQTVDVRLTIVGPKIEEHQARLEEQVIALKLTGKVEFQPPVTHDDVHKVLAAADVGVLTLSDVERNSKVGSSLSRLGEYLAAGRPVIAADVASARALLPEDGVVLYRPQDKQSLADAIVSLATEPARRVKLGAAARAASLDRDAMKIRADLVAIYMALTGTGARAVGDADATTPDEPTQLGVSALGASEDTAKRKAAAKKAAKGEAPSGTNKVKTDPALAVDQTSPEAQAGGDRPAVMGVPLRDDPPVVLGQELHQDMRDAAAELGQVSTEPNARVRSEPPVVMGMPLADAPRAKPESYTPGDLAAELGEIDSAQPGLDAPTAPVPDEPRHLDDAPKTGSHLSLVPPAAQSLDDEPMPTVPTRPPEPDEPPASAPTPLPAPPVSAPPVATPPSSPPAPSTIIPPLEMPPPLNSGPSGFSASSPGSARSAPPPLGSPGSSSAAPPVGSSPSGISPPFSSSPTQLNSPPLSSPPFSSSPTQLTSPPPSSPPQLTSPPLSTPPPPFSSSPSGLTAPALSSSPSGVAPLPFSSSPTPLTSPALSSSPSGLTPPPLSSSPSGLTSPPPFSSSPSGLTAPPPLPPKLPSAGVSVPPLPQRPTGSFPVVPAPAGGPPQLPKQPQAPPLPKAAGSVPPLPKTSVSGAFPVIPVGPQPTKPTVSGSFPVIPVGAPPQRTVTGSFPVVPAGPSAPAPRPSASSAFVPYNPPVRSSPSGSFNSAPTPVPATTSKGSTGLFPEPPSVPEKPEEIDESEIEQVSESVEAAVEEVGADEIVEVGGTPARGSPKAAPAAVPPAPAGVPSSSPSATGDDAPVMSEESFMTVDTDPSPPQSAINPWLAQLVHGYCPPESGLFERHTPPTTMPGRDT